MWVGLAALGTDLVAAGVVMAVFAGAGGQVDSDAADVACDAQDENGEAEPDEAGGE